MVSFAHRMVCAQARQGGTELLRDPAGRRRPRRSGAARPAGRGRYDPRQGRKAARHRPFHRLQARPGGRDAGFQLKAKFPAEMGDRKIRSTGRLVNEFGYRPSDGGVLPGQQEADLTDAVVILIVRQHVARKLIMPSSVSPPFHRCLDFPETSVSDDVAGMLRQSAWRRANGLPRPDIVPPGAERRIGKLKRQAGGATFSAWSMIPSIPWP